MTFLEKYNKQMTLRFFFFAISSFQWLLQILNPMPLNV